jgi:hypothetical protein
LFHHGGGLFGNGCGCSVACSDCGTSSGCTGCAGKMAPSGTIINPPAPEPSPAPVPTGEKSAFRPRIGAYSTW